MAPARPTSPKPNAITPGLYLVATPIGNLGDITLRALDILAGVDVVLSEDTRVAGKLLAAHGVSAKLERYDDHVSDAVRDRVLDHLAAGAAVALISDAGTPTVSDPGFKLVRAAITRGINVRAAPGASAVLAALSICGLATDRFLFAGFSPPKRAARQALFAELAPVKATLIFYESGPRLRESLSDMAEVFGPRQAVVARELTKLHETVIRGPLDELARDPALNAPKGEIVVLVDRGVEPVASAADVDVALTEAVARLGPAGGAAEVAKALGLPRRELYARALALREAEDSDGQD